MKCKKNIHAWNACRATVTEEVPQLLVQRWLTLSESRSGTAKI